MNRLVIVLVAILGIVSFAFAEMGQPTVETVTLAGTIVDNACAGGHMQDLANFVKTHTKDCALMSGCVESGYGIYADGKFAKFDKASNAKVEEFLRKADSNLEVVVEAKKAGEEFQLISIRNR